MLFRSVSNLRRTEEILGIKLHLDNFLQISASGNEIEFEQLEKTNTSQQFFYYNNLFASKLGLKEIVTGLLPDKTLEDITEVTNKAHQYKLRSLSDN